MSQTSVDVRPLVAFCGLDGSGQDQPFRLVVPVLQLWILTPYVFQTATMESMARKQGMSTRKTAGIIAACTLAMMNNIGSGTAMTVTLPDIGRDLSIAEANLQWIISGYTLTSVRRGSYLPVSCDTMFNLSRPFFLSTQLCIGLFPPLIRPNGRSSWAAERFPLRRNLDCHLGHWVWVCSHRNQSGCHASP